ncbi:ABC transporter substrate-binding protein [Halomarina oriensis]|uniref:ABC transporter substrate-binding protein n=1 Tax=Halomarina oriensis TaxID=671145 RepID=A0A6B0GHX2_9EURY|nr:ABC transporter substrate-binding protein [Halomarina oriensis]MWG33507.1 ABC transporter substrate-binding protein [Halomarina oriensis]
MVHRKDSATDQQVSRRRVLQLGSGAAIVTLAGCTSGGDGDNGSNSTDGSGGGDSGDGNGSTEDGTTGAGDGRQGGTLKVAQAKSPVDWDPVNQWGGPAAIIAERFFSNLYTLDESTGIVPDDLVTGMPEAERDGQRYVVEIVDNAMFHNGDPVTGEDIAYTFRAPIEEETRNATALSMIDTIEVVDETTVQFDLKYPYAAFAGALSQMGIVPKAVREADVQAYNTTNPVASGPFKFVDWTENEFTRIEKWDDYWGEKDPNLDAVEYIPIPEPTTRMTEFNSGDMHMMQDIPPRLYSTVEQMNDAEIHQTPALSYRFLTFNLNEGETTKLGVRQAINHTFSMDAFVERFVEPAGVRQYQPIPIPTAEAWDMPIDEFESMAVGKDIDAAKSMFEEAGVPDDWNCVILSPPDDVRENLCITVANGIKEAGYNAEVQRLDWGAYLEKYATGKASDYQMYALGWSVNPDPDYQIYSMYHESGAGSNNGHYWDDPEVMEMIEQSRQSTDREERRQLYIDIQKEVIQQRVQIPGYNLKETWARKSAVQDFSVHPVPTENPRLVTAYNNVWLDE